MAVTIDQHHGFKPFRLSQRCRLQSFTLLDNKLRELSQTNLAHSLKEAFKVANVHRSFSMPCLSLATRVEEEFDPTPRIEIISGCGIPRVRALVVEVAIALASGMDPLPVSSGLGGAYFLRGRNGDNIALAKPIDEEPLAFNNPKGFGGLMLGQPGLKRSVRVGETGIRELAAYLLDHDGFAGVPTTALVKISHVAFHVRGELGPSGFSVASVHRIGIFDVRLLNLDRHAGNMLVKKHDQHENYSVGAAELVPIDHGLCLPEWLDDPYFEWQHWPQASVPFSESELEYISNLDGFKDAELLRKELPSLRESSIRVLVLCTIFLKRAAAAGLCLSDIGEMMTREFCGGEENISVLENLCAEAKAKLGNASIDETNDHDERIEESEEDFEIFQFDNDFEETSKLQNPKVMAKQPKIPRFSSVKSMPGMHDATLSPLYEEVDNDRDIDDNVDLDTKSVKGNGNGDNDKIEALTRSMSFAVQNCNNSETGFVTFGDMSESEWEIFSENFGKLLPEVFEGTKFMGLKQRLGTSCKF
ncbi:phosphatidylinositol 4-kinase gamma 8-like isoform X2 [Tripterygium wilfordii]|uniref:phosphatidylinositol 4-kinase gamma 8-like isoform X2 n=1 Tax=Tripterygium wilfordii TaxID=458696 RepID=UPI0018F81EA1|nr:phosphatidylinositol 4-kinase gamma 8-like isoform X2 [Tripterygium wilfordii]